MKRTAALVLLCCAIAPVFARQQSAPIQNPAPTSGTALIAGIVVNDETPPIPVRRAIVTLAGAELVPSRSAVTDDNGAFSIEHLPAGRFLLTVSRASFVTSTYGAKRPGRAGTALVLTTGQRLTGLSVTLWRGAVIAGVVRGEDAAPASGVPVSVIAAHPPGDTTIFSLTNSGAITNDQGEFRIFGLEAGTYLVVATPPVLRGAPITSTSDAELDAAFAALRSRGAAGSTPPARAAGTPASVTPVAPLPSVNTKPFTYSSIFYPGTANPRQATPVTVVAGQVAEGIDLSLQRVTTAVVTGIVVRADGQPAGSSQTLVVQAPPPGYVLDSPSMTSAIVGADGTFRIAALAPGDYTLTAKAGVAGPPTGGIGGGPSLWGQTTFTVSGEDISDLRIRVEPGPTLSGRVVFAADGLTPPADLSQWRVSIVPPARLEQRPGPVMGTIAYMPPVPVKPDGTFEIASISPGPYVVQVTGPGVGASGWWPRSLIAGDRDLLDRAVDIVAGGSSMSAVLTMSDKHTELSGTLMTAAGGPALDVFVIAFAADRQLWGPGARRVRAVRPGRDGRYVFADLPPGDYLLAAKTDIDAYETQNPAVLEALIPTSLKITIGEGEKKVQNLRIGG